MSVVRKIAFASFLILASLESSATASPASSRQPLDPNEKVCEDVTATGSRLATKRICATRAEWAEKRKQDKDTLDAIQRGPNVGCSVVNTHSGTPSC